MRESYAARTGPDTSYTWTGADDQYYNFWNPGSYTPACDGSSYDYSVYNAMGSDGFGAAEGQVDAVGDGDLCTSNIGQLSVGIGGHVGTFEAWKTGSSLYSITLNWNLDTQEGSFYVGTGYGIGAETPYCAGGAELIIQYAWALWDQTTETSTYGNAWTTILDAYPGDFGLACTTMMDASMWSYYAGSSGSYPFPTDSSSATDQFGPLTYLNYYELRAVFLGYTWVTQSGEGLGTVSSVFVYFDPTLVSVEVS